MSIELTINGARQAFEVPEGASLLELLRDHAGITSPKDGCSPQGQCGACVVLVDGSPKTSCAVPAKIAAGKSVLTLEGVSEEERRIYGEAFARMAGLQCGFCIPGITMKIKSVLDSNPEPSDEEIRKKLDPHLCRCTGYVKIFEAFQAAALLRRGGTLPPADGSGRVGTSLDRYEAEELALGARPYVCDLTFPGMLHGAVTLSPHARAKVKRIDTSKAAAYPGVAAVVTAKDVPGQALLRPDRRGLAGVRGRGRRDKLRGRRPRRGRRGGRADGARGRAARRGRVRGPDAGDGSGEGARAGRPPRGSRGKSPLALGRPPRRRGGGARLLRARRRGDMADAAHRASVSGTRSVPGRAGRRDRGLPGRRDDALHAGARGLRRSPAGLGVPEYRARVPPRRPRPQRRRVRRQGGHVDPGSDGVARARHGKAGAPRPVARGIDPHPSQAPPDPHALPRRLRR